MKAEKQYSAGYRPEIDGLRAVAVVSVIVYHINKAWLPGGYVGVDVFFVISGFLITSIIWRELHDGTFSLADFYLRRIRRIIPVMLVVVATTLLAGCLLLLPDALERLAVSAIYSVVSAGNIYFWRFLDDDYFAEASDQEPLLHLWSLGVEEQFYLVWPLLLMLVLSVRKNGAAVAILSAVVIAVASFALAEATNESNPKLSYFMLPTRAGEMMIGAMLPLALRRSGKLGWIATPVAAEIVGAIGLAAIGYSVFFLDDLSPFPGVNALYPCVGAALVILSGTRSRLLRWLLANRPMVWVGLISYSLYLWHWPILAFIRYFFGSVGPMHAAIAAAAILVLSVLSYRHVERPTRRVQWSGMRQVASLLVVPGLMMIVPSAYVVKTDGLRDIIESSAGYKRGFAILKEETAAAFNFDYNCQLSKHVPGILSDARCVVGSLRPREGGPRVLLWGDSHAAHHLGALDIIGQYAGIQIRNASHSSCPPVFGGDYSYGKYKAGCSEFRPYIREQIGTAAFDVVIFGAGWAAYDRQPEFRSDLVRTIAEVRASGARVVLLGQVPTLVTYNRECDMRWLRFGESNCSELRVRNKGRAINSYLASLATHDGAISYLDIGSAICDSASCPAYLEGKPIYFDKSHLSMRGSRRVGERLVETGQARHWTDAIAGRGWSSAALPEGRAVAQRAERDPLVDGTIDLPVKLELGVPHHVVKDTMTQNGESIRRKVVVEFEQMDARVMGLEVTNRMIAAGHRLTGTSTARGGQRFNFRVGQGVRVTILVLPPPATDLVNATSTGSMEIVQSWPREIRSMQ